MSSGIDSSSAAIELAKENILLNSFDPDRISVLKEDAAQFMKKAAAKKESWDLVILDPPKLAPNRKVSFFSFFSFGGHHKCSCENMLHLEEFSHFCMRFVGATFVLKFRG